ncbi:MAG TPA: RNA 2',3'-cyclic phosphodiesterase [Steroidobacteraceae bacterium]|nr:RNA 2',3'-cyclic phosphodiesterase [Steroidobacteraceae bacterium]
MRLFFALWPDASTARQLAQLAGCLTIGARGRLVNPRNYHATLAFVGEVSALKLAVLQQIGRSLRAAPFTLICDSTEYWPRPKVVVALAREAPLGLLDLWARLHDAIALPRTELHTHVTLARKVAQAPVLQAMSPLVWQVASFSLVRSETGGVESAYTVLDTWPLLYTRENH